MIGQTTPEPSILPGLVQYGVLGIVVVAILLGWLWPKPGVEQLRKDKEAAEARAERAELQRDEFARELQDVLPVVKETTAAYKRMLPLLEALVDERTPRRR